jgi:hypothetical protein
VSIRARFVKGERGLHRGTPVAISLIRQGAWSEEDPWREPHTRPPWPDARRLARLNPTWLDGALKILTGAAEDPPLGVITMCLLEGSSPRPISIKPLFSLVSPAGIEPATP